MSYACRLGQAIAFRLICLLFLLQSINAGEGVVFEYCVDLKFQTLDIFIFFQEDIKLLMFTDQCQVLIYIKRDVSAVIFHLEFSP